MLQCPVRGGDAVCLPGEVFVHHGRSEPVGRGVGNAASDEGFCVGDSDGPGRRVGGGGSCFRQFVSGLVAWYALVTWNPGKGVGAFPVV